MIETKHIMHLSFEATPTALAACSHGAMFIHRSSIVHQIRVRLDQSGMHPGDLRFEVPYDIHWLGVKGEFSKRADAVVVDAMVRDVVQNYTHPAIWGPIYKGINS